ncbi:MAG: hypothetical protein Ta2D_13800 [Rickettsiales bacterium]|nr:MAG: hypothetical protein Ta2D_13800 [Rickettsiales bacterium]
MQINFCKKYQKIIENKKFKNKIENMTDNDNINNSNNIDKNNADFLEQEYKNLKAQATDFFKNNLQGRSIDKEGLGNIRMTRKSKHKILHYADTNKLKTILQIENIIKNSKIREYQDLQHPRKDDITGFYYLESDITNIINDKKPHQAEILIATDSRGLLLYDIFIDSTNKERQAEKEIKKRIEKTEHHSAPDSILSINNIITNNN